MRTVSNDVVTDMTSSRQIGSRLTVRDTRLVFSQADTADNSVSSEAQFYDAVVLSDGILRIASVYDVSWIRHLYYQYCNDLSTPSAWVNSGITLWSTSRPGVYAEDTPVAKARIFYHGGDGYSHYIDFTVGGGLGSPVSIPSLLSFWGGPDAYAPISLTQFYYHYQLSSPPITTGNLGFIEYHVLGEELEEWEGSVYGLNQFTTCFDAEVITETDGDGNSIQVGYIFFSDSDTKRGLYLKHTMFGGYSFWETIRQIVPMDVVDETSTFMFSAVTKLDNKLFCTGILKRDYGAAMHVYTMGPDHWSMGRDMYIFTGDVITKSVSFLGVFIDFAMPAGKLLLTTDYLWYTGIGYTYQAVPTMLVGVDTASKKTVVTNDSSSIQVETTTNNPLKMTSYLNTSQDTTLFQPGNQVDLELSYGGHYATMNRFDIDIASSQHEQTGSLKSIIASSKAMKALYQWRSDANYDYWSQTKGSSSPGDMAKVIRSSGLWSGATDLTLTNLNVDGYLYSVEKAARGMIVKAKFNRPVETTYYTASYGLVLNYYRETIAEAAARIGKDEADISDTDYGHNGIVVCYESGAVNLYLLRANVMTKLVGPWSVSDPGVADHWFMAQFSDGRIQVWFKADTDLIWALVGSYRFTSYTEFPWKRTDQVGRGGVYVRNKTPYSASYGFESTDMIIPVANNSVFPSTETVIVDSEKISYRGLSTNTVITGIEYALGDPVQQFTTVGNVDYMFTDAVSRAAIQQGILATGNFTILGVSVYVRKNGTATFTNGLAVGLYQGISADAPMGVMLGCGVVAPGDITTSYEWKDCYFNTPIQITSGESYSLEMYKERIGDYGFPNCYYVMLNSSNAYASGGISVYNNDTEAWTVVTSHDMCFKLFGYATDDTKKIILSGLTVPEKSWTYNDMALVVTAGQGAGSMFRVLNYGGLTVSGNQILITDKSPFNMVGQDSVFSLVPTLKVLTRGASSTDAVAHLASQVSVYSALSPECIQLDYYSDDVDIRLEDMIAEIAGKAGVDVIGEKLLQSHINATVPGWHVHDDMAATGESRKNCICKLRRCSGAGYYGMAFLSINNEGAAIVINDDSVELYEVWYGGDIVSILDSIPINTVPLGWVTFSFFDGYISVWAGTKLLASFRKWEFVPKETTPQITISKIGIVTNGTVSFDVDWSELDTRVDNYILDMGTDGISLVNEVARERRVFFGDDQYGDLEIFKTRTEINPTEPYTLSIISGGYDSDIGIATRIREVGIDIIEVADTNLLQNYGNVFQLIQSDKITSYFDLEIEAGRVLDDINLKVAPYTLVGALDPRVEPQDILRVRFLEGDKDIVVDQINARMEVNETGVVMDMEVSGYELI